MEHKSRDTIVGLFTLISLFCFGWLVFRFGDLPGFISKMDANQVLINFREIPGIQENSAVYFRGFSIGKVIAIDPPAVRNSGPESTNRDIYAVVTITLPKEYDIPNNIVPKIFQRSLGSSYIELSLADKPAEVFLTDGDVLYGEISSGSQFISESTQNKLDSLIVSLNQLSNSLQSQLQTITPTDVDNQQIDVNANLTTAIIRFDTTLKNINEIIGDTGNKINIKTLLSDLAAASSEARTLIANTSELMKNTGQTVDNIDSYVKQATESFTPLAARTQEVADNLIAVLQTANSFMTKASDGNGTITRLLDDPTLYESLSDTAERLSLAAQELQNILKLWQENGVKMKL